MSVLNRIHHQYEIREMGVAVHSNIDMLWIYNRMATRYTTKIHNCSHIAIRTGKGDNGMGHQSLSRYPLVGINAETPDGHTQQSFL